MKSLACAEIFEWLHQVPLAYDVTLRDIIHIWFRNASTRVELSEKFCDDEESAADSFAVHIKVTFNDGEDPQKIAQLQALGFRWSAGFQTATRFMSSFEELEMFFGLLIIRWQLAGVLPASLAFARPQAPLYLEWPIAA